MAKLDFRYLPLEQSRGAYPLLVATAEDKSFLCIPETARKQILRGLFVFLDYHEYVLRAVLLKGAFLGACCFALFFGVFAQPSLWLQSWHWAMLVGGIGILLLLVGFDFTFLSCIALFSCIAVKMYLPWLLPFLSGGIIFRYIMEKIYHMFHRY